ncbi:Ig-like domain-containing protein [Pseudomonas palleroniana]|uniref:Ig-like domain-containing protein n=1 Tax=Pseudomonas palleroniana TaxID=191390 RepID=UPI0018E6754C|nr:YncE family protein [Pseudomonas palleroniana]MBI6908981.1 YncE family protein [Pseudomonas palleroniana]
MSRRPPASPGPAGHCLPCSHHLPKSAPGPVNPPATRVEDLDPPPYSAFPSVNIQLAQYPEVGEYGLGIRHVWPFAQFVFERWFLLSPNDYFAVYLGDLINPAADDIVLDDRPRYDLFIPGERVEQGLVKIYGRVLRAGSSSESTSPIQTILIKTTRPGGTSKDPGVPWHTNLILSVDGYPAGSVINPQDVANGLWCLIEWYENIRENDVIELSWDGIFVFHTVSPTEAAGPGPIWVFVPKSVIDAGGQAGELIIRFRVRDVVLNYSGEKYQYSGPYFLNAELDNSLILAPRFLVNGDLLDSKQIDIDTQGDAIFEVLINTGPVFPQPNPKRQLTVTLVATLMDGAIKNYTLGPVIDNNFGVTFVPVDNDIIKEIVGGSFRVSFTWLDPAGVELGRSGSLTITVVGTPQSMPAVKVSPIELGLIPVDTPITVDFPDYEPHDPSWLERLVIRHIPSGGGAGITFTQEQFAGGQGGERHVSAAELEPFKNKGLLEFFYEVDTGAMSILGGSALTVRKSEVLTAQIGERTADMPKPILQGVIGDNVDPDDVSGKEVLVTFPFLGTQSGDTLHYTCTGSGLNGSASGSIPINGSTAGKPLPYPVSRDILDNNRNGTLRISYSLSRPGTPPLILRSEVLYVTVGVAVDLDRPIIVGASTSPDAVNPLALLSGATVEAAFRPMLASDHVFVDWSSTDGMGSNTQDVKGNPATNKVSVLIPPRIIAQGIRDGGQTINVRYRFRRGMFDFESETVPLRLLPLTGLPEPKIDGVSGPVLDLSQLSDTARTRVAMWSFIHEAQRMWMRYEGFMGGLPWFKDTYNGDLVTADGVTNGIRPLTPVDELKQLDDGSALTITFRASLAESADINTAILFGVTTYIVQAVPSILRHPTIKGASGTGPSVTLDPLPVEHNTEVTVSYPGMSDKDRITLKWIFANGNVEERSVDGVAGGTVVFNVTTAGFLHRSVGTIVQLRYVVVRQGVADPIPSEVQTVQVNAIPVGSLPRALINGLANGETLDLNAFTGDAKASLAKWSLSHTGQRVWITCRSAGVADLEVLTSAGTVITATEAANGLVNKVVLRTWLGALADNKAITVHTAVTFDGDTDRAKAVAFPSTTYALKSLISTPVTLGVRDSKGPIANNGPTYEESVTISGKAAANQQVELFENNVHRAYVTASGTGDWSYVRSGLQVRSYAFRAVGRYGILPSSETITINRYQPLQLDQSPITLNGRAIIAAGWTKKAQYPGNSVTRAATGGKAPVTYTSRDATIATVTAGGLVVGMKNGSTVIDVRDSLGTTRSVNVNVSNVWQLRENRNPQGWAQAVNWRKSLPGAEGMYFENGIQLMGTAYGWPLPVPFDSYYWCCTEPQCDAFTGVYWDSLRDSHAVWCMNKNTATWAWCLQP